MLWGTIVVWAYSMVAQLWRNGGQVYETIQVAMDGTPVITSRSMTDYLDSSFRTLDGQTITQSKDDEWLTAAAA